MNSLLKVLLDKVPGWADREEIAITPLSGGITNQNFKVELDGEAFVLRICGKDKDLLGIRREHEVICSNLAADLGIGARIVHFLPEEGLLVAEFLTAPQLSPENLRHEENLKRVIDSIKKYHEGPEFPGSFSPFGTIRKYHELALQKHVKFGHEFNEAFQLMRRMESALQSNRKLVPCHNDLLAGNFLDDGENVFILDWEYAGMGDLFFDLGNLSAMNEFTSEDNELLLKLYFGKVESGHFARLSLMRLASDLRESLWAQLQSGISTLDFDYKAYAKTHVERFLKEANGPEFGSWLKEVNR